MESPDVIKRQVIEALSHPEAEEGLYLDNLHHLHEEDERTRVQGNELQILDVIKELIDEGKVRADESGESVIFFIVK